jgi:hypothetical protein
MLLRSEPKTNLNLQLAADASQRRKPMRSRQAPCKRSPPLDPRTRSVKNRLLNVRINRSRGDVELVNVCKRRDLSRSMTTIARVAPALKEIPSCNNGIRDPKVAANGTNLALMTTIMMATSFMPRQLVKEVPASIHFTWDLQATSRTWTSSTREVVDKLNSPSMLSLGAR